MNYLHTLKTIVAPKVEHFDFPVGIKQGQREEKVNFLMLVFKSRASGSCIGQF